VLPTCRASKTLSAARQFARLYPQPSASCLTGSPKKRARSVAGHTENTLKITPAKLLDSGVPGVLVF
jgi:hypothetical protein